MLKEGFIKLLRLVEWLSIVVPVVKNNRKLKACTNFIILNSATPKNKYLMPSADMLINRAAKHQYLPFIDSYLGYSQIMILEEGITKTTFKCSRAIRTYEWLVVPFRLKNTKITYEKVIKVIFHNFSRKFLEILVNDSDQVRRS